MPIAEGFRDLPSVAVEATLAGTDAREILLAANLTTVEMFSGTACLRQTEVRGASSADLQQ